MDSSISFSTIDLMSVLGDVAFHHMGKAEKDAEKIRPSRRGEKSQSGKQ